MVALVFTVSVIALILVLSALFDVGGAASARWIEITNLLMWGVVSFIIVIGAAARVF